MIAGRKGWLYEPVFEAIRRLELGERVQTLDFVGDSDLPMVYNLADVFAYPSIYEGFGFPVLEAGACGLPVVCAATSSLPEAAGDAALLVDPLDTAALAAALRRIVGDTQLRQDLIAKGHANLARFRWEDVAAQTLGVLEAAGSGRLA